MGGCKPYPTCKDSRPCFGKDEHGKCRILEFGVFTIKTGEDTPTVAEVLGVKPGKPVTVQRKPYEDGACKFRKECYKDVVINGQIARKNTEGCEDCPVVDCKRRKSPWI